MVSVLSPSPGLPGNGQEFLQQQQHMFLSHLTVLNGSKQTGEEESVCPAVSVREITQGQQPRLRLLWHEGVGRGSELIKVFFRLGHGRKGSGEVGVGRSRWRELLPLTVVALSSDSLGNEDVQVVSVPRSLRGRLALGGVQLVSAQERSPEDWE